MSHLAALRQLPYQSEFKALLIVCIGCIFPALQLSNKFSFSYTDLLHNPAYAILYAASIIILARYISGSRFNRVRKDLTGQTIIITGANTGIGFHCAIQLAKLNANLILGVRGQNRAEKAAALIKQKANNSTGTIVGLHLDLSHLQAVKEFVIRAKKHCNNRVDILLNNAGVMTTPYQLTSDGFELQMGTNCIGHHYLTKLLLPLLISAKGRVVNVSSFAHYSAVNGIHMEKQLNKSSYNRVIAYGESKLGNIYFSMELARRYGCKGLTAYSLAPGAINTGLMRHIQFVYLPLKPLFLIIMRTPFEGAQTSLYCCLEDKDKLISGEYYRDCRLSVRSEIAKDKTQAKLFFDRCEQLIAERMPDYEIDTN